jgi:hypothetical protein
MPETRVADAMRYVTAKIEAKADPELAARSLKSKLRHLASILDGQVGI